MQAPHEQTVSEPGGINMNAVELQVAPLISEGGSHTRKAALLDTYSHNEHRSCAHRWGNQTSYVLQCRPTHPAWGCSEALPELCTSLVTRFDKCCLGRRRSSRSNSGRWSAGGSAGWSAGGSVGSLGGGGLGGGDVGQTPTSHLVEGQHQQNAGQLQSPRLQ